LGGLVVVLGGEGFGLDRRHNTKGIDGDVSEQSMQLQSPNIE
jgi:hypothetical protein